MFKFQKHDRLWLGSGVSLACSSQLSQPVTQLPQLATFCCTVQVDWWCFRSEMGWYKLLRQNLEGTCLKGQLFGPGPNFAPSHFIIVVSIRFFILQNNYYLEFWNSYKKLVAQTIKSSYARCLVFKSPSFNIAYINNNKNSEIWRFEFIFLIQYKLIYGQFQVKSSNFYIYKNFEINLKHEKQKQKLLLQV